MADSPDYSKPLSRWSYAYWGAMHGVADAVGANRWSVLVALSTALPSVMLGVETIAQRAGVSSRTVQRAMRELRQIGAITYQDTVGGKGHTYTVAMADVRYGEVAEQIIATAKGRQPVTVSKGDSVTPLTPSKGDSLSAKGDNVSVKGDTLSSKGDTLSPEVRNQEHKRRTQGEEHTAAHAADAADAAWRGTAYAAPQSSSPLGGDPSAGGCGEGGTPEQLGATSSSAQGLEAEPIHLRETGEASSPAQGMESPGGAANSQEATSRTAADGGRQSAAQGTESPTGAELQADPHGAQASGDSQAQHTAACAATIKPNRKAKPEEREHALTNAARFWAFTLHGPDAIDAPSAEWANLPPSKSHWSPTTRDMRNPEPTATQPQLACWFWCWAMHMVKQGEDIKHPKVSRIIGGIKSLNDWGRSRAIEIMQTIVWQWPAVFSHIPEWRRKSFIFDEGVLSDKHVVEAALAVIRGDQPPTNSNQTTNAANAAQPRSNPNVSYAKYASRTVDPYA